MPRLKKRWGQHHLVDGGLCAPMIRFLDGRGRRVLEVGPGGGVLTRELVAAGSRVLAWEIDSEWAFALRRSSGPGGEPPGGRTLVVIGDALEIPWQRLPDSTLVTGNLPFNVATAIIKGVLGQGQRFPRSAFLVQKEVADRLLARPGDSAYASLSVFVACRARSWRLGRVRAGSFRPPPKVESAFVGFETIDSPVPPAHRPAFDRFVRAAFALPRKTLTNSLGRSSSTKAVAAALVALGMDPRTRAGQISVEGFLALFEYLVGEDHEQG